MGETYNAGGFHSGFLSGKANRPYKLIASGAVLTEEKNENGSVGPTRADTSEFKSQFGPSQLKGSRSVKSQRRDIQINEMLESGMKTFFNENRPKFGHKHYRAQNSMLKDPYYKI